MGRAFISCVKENVPEARFLVSVLQQNGVDAWLFSRNLKIGQDWQEVIRQEIQNGTSFIPLFSKAQSARERSYMNEELVLAVEELRLRPTSAQWLFPLSLDGTPPPNMSIGGGRFLHNIQFGNLAADGRAVLISLLEGLGVTKPKIDHGDPIGGRFGARADIRIGKITYRNNTLAIPQLTNVNNIIDKGFVGRSENGKIAAQFHVVSTNVETEALGEDLGLATVFLTTEDRVLSTDPREPTQLVGESYAALPAGYQLRSGDQYVTLPQAMSVTSHYIANGALIDDRFEGVFQIQMSVDPMGVPAEVNGTFEVQLQES